MNAQLFRRFGSYTERNPAVGAELALVVLAAPPLDRISNARSAGFAAEYDSRIPEHKFIAREATFLCCGRFRFCHLLCCVVFGGLR